MVSLRAAACAALVIFCVPTPGSAQDVTLSSRDGAVELSGNLLGFDGEFYRVDTVYGELTVDGAGVICHGPGCPDLEAYVARVTFSGAALVGRFLMPALVESFAIRENLDLARETLPDGQLRHHLSTRDSGARVGEFTFRLTTTDEGFADLLANEADIAMTRREARESELERARNAGLGDLSVPARARVLALDALVPVVSPSQPVDSITLPQLARVLAGEIANWADLGGPDAPIALHLPAGDTGLGQGVTDRLLRPASLSPAATATRHASSADLAAAVLGDPFALAVTALSETGNTWELALTGACGFALAATRRNVKSEDYPLTAPLFLYLPARRLPPLAREFLDFLQDPVAQMVVRRAGFVDQAPEEIALNAQGDRFANAILRAGAGVDLEDLQRMVQTLAPLRRLTTTFRFETGSARLDAQSRANVRQLARALELGLYDARQLVFVGFSDGNGPADANRRIAQNRAQAVRKAVTTAAETASLDRIDMATEAFGEALPMACDDSAWGAQVNRRVEVWVR